MASHVTVIATDLRRTTVKVTPSTYMTDVLQEACKKLNLSPDKYLLKNKQKQVDLSIVWRQAGLTPGAKLELVQKSKTPSAVSVALQLPPPEASIAPNGRLIEKLPSHFSVWQVLRQFESGVPSQGKNLNLTARGIAQTQAGAKSGSGQLYYETPVLNIMGRELSSFVDFQKTLSQLGYNSGSVLLRLSFRKTDKTLFEAMGEISQLFTEAEVEEKEEATASLPTEAPAPAPAPVPTEESTPQPLVPAKQQDEGDPIDNSQSTPNTDPPPPTLQPETQEAIPMDVDTTTPSDPLQPVGIFTAPSGTTPAAALAPVSEVDYAPTIAHAQLHQARLQQNSQNKRLASDRELEEQARAAEAKLASIASVLVKVRFPDNTSAQWSFGPEATGALLYKGVRTVMANDSHKFKLVLPGNRIAIKDEETTSTNRLIHDYKLTSNVLVNLVWDDAVPASVRKQPFLKGSAAQQATAVKIPELPKDVYDKEEGRRAVQSSKPEPSSSQGDGGVAKKLPKWLKLPGKK